MIRNEKDKEEHRVEILAASQDLIFSRDYETTTIQEIIEAWVLPKALFSNILIQRLIC